MNEVPAVVDAYFAAWNEADPTKRRPLVERAWKDDGHYADPMFEACGHEAIDHMVAGVHEQFPGHSLRRTSAVDLHHDQAWFGWELVSPDGTVVVAGIDVATFAPGGRLARVTGFFGDLTQEVAA